MVDDVKQGFYLEDLAGSARGLSIVARILAVNLDAERVSHSDAELDVLLAFLLEEDDEGRTVCSTDLVRLRRFGTLPTVTKKLKVLESLGFIERPKTSDRRIKALKPTAAAHAHFEALALAISEAIKA